MKKQVKYFILIVIILIMIILAYFGYKFYIIHKIEKNLEELSLQTNYSYVVKYGETTVNSNTFTKYSSLNNMKLIEDSTGIIEAQFGENEVYSFDNSTKQYLENTNKNSLNEKFKDNVFQNFKYIFNSEGEDEQSISFQLKLALKMKIKVENYNNIECYALSYKTEDNYIVTIYIDKENLLRVAQTMTDNNEYNDTINYEWEFNTQVEDNYNKEIILSGYTKAI